MSDKVEKVKKRKRNTDGASKPSKRVAIEDDKQIRVSVSDAGSWAPVIGTRALEAKTRIWLCILYYSMAYMHSFYTWPGFSDFNPLESIHESPQKCTLKVW